MFLVLTCRRFLHYGPSFTHCCRALILALARLSCTISVERFAVMLNETKTSRPRPGLWGRGRGQK